MSFSFAGHLCSTHLFARWWYVGWTVLLLVLLPSPLLQSTSYLLQNKHQAAAAAFDDFNI
jgi:hypothetical protein